MSAKVIGIECPKCGANRVQVFDMDWAGWTVVCLECGTQFHISGTDEDNNRDAEAEDEAG